MPITEPAVGYGLAALPVLLRPTPEAGAQGYARPNISTMGGHYTSNGTWGLFGGGYASINLKYYDDSSAKKGAPSLEYNLKLGGGLTHGRFRIQHSKFYAGVRYPFLRVDATAKPESSSVSPPTRWRATVG